VKRVLVIAGEISGDMHAARLVEAVQSRHSDVSFFGIGGDALRATGMDILIESRDMAVMGLTDVIVRLSFFQYVMDEMLSLLHERKPDAVLLVDYPGFNLRFAARAKQRGIRVIYYICPQVWAWHRSRIPKIARIVDRLICIFPFEPALFEKTGLKADFVGHPLADVAATIRNRDRHALPWPGTEHIALLPGSRMSEIQLLFPQLCRAAQLLEKERPDAGFLVAAASEQVAGVMKTYLSESAERPDKIQIVTDETREVLVQARAAVVASGTATIEAALMGCPMLVVYKMPVLSFIAARLLVRVPSVGMVNVVAGRRICPELIQRDARAEGIVDALMPLIEQGPKRDSMLHGLDEVRRALGSGGTAEKAATILLEELGD